MKKITLSAVAILSMAGTFSSILSADEGFTLFSNTKFNGEVRARYENVDVEDSGKKEANAYTVRATLGLETNLLGVNGLSMKVDGTTVQTIGATKYDNDPRTTVGDSRYEAVADPEQTRFTQAYLQYKLGNTALKAGRQIINLDNERFIGSVDWRQMMQSFDAVTLTNTSVTGLNLTGAYVYSYATAFNEPTWDSKSVILNGSYKISDMVKVTAYDYMISSEKTAYGSDTVGLALTGEVPLSIAKINYRAEYAKQGDATFKTVGSANVQNDAQYYNLDALSNISGILAGVGYEVLSGTTGSDGKTAFSTPLATLHKFNGWADKFLATPTGGLCDASATLGYTTPTLGKAMVVYHNYTTDVAMSGKSDLGREWDMLYTNTIPGVKGLNGLIKAAYYQGGDVAGNIKDVSKVWLQATYKF
ncbi:MAG: alginate export family protein [Campylobacterales bacterium]|nr:alginate export family protein [Campylobacterales bacterium]